MSPRLALCGGLAAWLACSDASPPEPRRAQAQASLPAPQTADARAIENSAERRAPTTASAVRRPPRRGAGVRAAVQHRAPASLDDALLAMQPADAVAKLEELMGPLEGGHYVLQRGSEIEVDGGIAPLDGELSLLHCFLLQPGQPDLGRELWPGGWRLDGARGLAEALIERSLVIPVLGREVRYSGRWSDVREVGGRVWGFSRKLYAALDEVAADEVWVFRRDLLLVDEQESTAEFEASEDACPEDLDLHFVIRDVYEHWRLEEREGALHPVLVGQEDEADVARLRVVAHLVSGEPEIVDAAQRVVRAAPLPTGRAVAPETRRIRSPDARGAADRAPLR